MASSIAAGGIRTAANVMDAGVSIAEAMNKVNYMFKDAMYEPNMTVGSASPSIAVGNRIPNFYFQHVHLKADEACDLLNNVQGRIVGITTQEKEMNKIALAVIDKYYVDGFWVSKPIGNGKYAITREKLTEKQYKKIRDNIELLNKNGYKK